MEIQVSEHIDRPIADVWRFYAVEHVRNHPRRDPKMHLDARVGGLGALRCPLT
jgi:hypothetical protein